MADKKISELTALTTPDGAEELVVNDGGTSKKITIDNTIKSSFPNITTDVTSTTAELNILDGVTSTATELNYLDITTLGTQQASKAVTANASNIISSFESTGIDDNATSTAVTLDSSGNLLVGKTTNSSAVHGGEIRATGQVVAAVDGSWAGLFNRETSDGEIVRFKQDDSTVGSISVTSSSTSYNTSSDYRLKENVVPMTGSIDRLKELNPSRFNFITDPNTTVDGFLAHEAQEVVPEAITGEKDAMRTEEYEVTPAVEATYDDDGNELTPAVEAVMGEREVPDMQGIDQAKLVPLLVGAIQEQQTLIESLQADIAILKGATV